METSPVFWEKRKNMLKKITQNAERELKNLLYPDISITDFVAVFAKIGVTLSERICCQREQILSFKNSHKREESKYFYARATSRGGITVSLNPKPKR